MKPLRFTTEDIKAFLSSAAEGIAERTISLLEEFPEIVNSKSKEGRSALENAVSNGCKSIVQILLDHGATIESHAKSKDTWSIVKLACKRGHSDILKLLLDNIREKQRRKIRDMPQIGTVNQTCLMLGCTHGHNDVVNVLLDSENYETCVEVPDHDGNTALILAAAEGHTAIVSTLLEKGAELEAMNHEHHTALVCAAHNGHLYTVEFLRDQGAKLIVCDKDGSVMCTALTVAAGSRCAAVAVLENLLKPESPHALATATSALLDKALLSAARRGNSSVVEFLLKRGAAHGTSLIEAACHGHLDTVLLLLKCGADVNATNAAGCTALIRAACSGRTLVVKALLNANATINTSYRDGGTALMRAALYNHVNTLSVLLDAIPAAQRTDAMNLRDNAGRNALMRAAERGSISTVELLLHSGAEVFAVDLEGNTCLHHAVLKPASSSKSSHEGSIRLILTHLSKETAHKLIGVHNTAGKTALDVGCKHMRHLLAEAKRAAELFLMTDRELYCCKLFVLGFPKVGKSTLATSLARKRRAWYEVGHRVWTTATGDSAQSRTAGCHYMVSKTIAGAPGTWTIIDFEGPLGNHLSHELLRAATNSVFIVVFDSREPHATQDRKVHYWLRFIASKNSSTAPDMSTMARVVLVGGMADECDDDARISNQKFWATNIEVLTQQYAMAIELQKRVFHLNSHLSDDAATELPGALGKMRADLNSLPETMPCSRLVVEIDEHLHEFSKSKKIMAIASLRDLVQERIIRNSMYECTIQELKDALVKLDLMGKVIFFTTSTSPTLDEYVILDTEWFGKYVLGRLMAPHSEDRRCAQSVLSWDTIKSTGTEFLQLMQSDSRNSRRLKTMTPQCAEIALLVLQEMGLCVSLEPVGQAHLRTMLFPCTLPPIRSVMEAARLQSGIWGTNRMFCPRDSVTPKYMGRRLLLNSDVHLFPTSFFPAVQFVMLHQTPSMITNVELFQGGIRCLNESQTVAATIQIPDPFEEDFFSCTNNPAYIDICVRSLCASERHHSGCKKLLDAIVSICTGMVGFEFISFVPHVLHPDQINPSTGISTQSRTLLMTVADGENILADTSFDEQLSVRRRGVLVVNLLGTRLPPPVITVDSVVEDAGRNIFLRCSITATFDAPPDATDADVCYTVGGESVRRHGAGVTHIVGNGSCILGPHVDVVKARVYYQDVYPSEQSVVTIPVTPAPTVRILLRPEGSFAAAVAVEGDENTIIILQYGDYSFTSVGNELIHELPRNTQGIRVQAVAPCAKPSTLSSHPIVEHPARGFVRLDPVEGESATCEHKSKYLCSDRSDDALAWSIALDLVKFLTACMNADIGNGSFSVGIMEDVNDIAGITKLLSDVADAIGGEPFEPEFYPLVAGVTICRARVNCPTEYVESIVFPKLATLMEVAEYRASQQQWSNLSMPEKKALLRSVCRFDVKRVADIVGSAVQLTTPHRYVLTVHIDTNSVVKPFLALCRQRTPRSPCRQKSAHLLRDAIVKHIEDSHLESDSSSSVLSVCVLDILDIVFDTLRDSATQLSVGNDTVSKLRGCCEKVVSEATTWRKPVEFELDDHGALKRRSETLIKLFVFCNDIMKLFFHACTEGNSSNGAVTSTQLDDGEFSRVAKRLRHVNMDGAPPSSWRFPNYHNVGSLQAYFRCGASSNKGTHDDIKARKLTLQSQTA
eukprot:m.1155442 g.1155442  ORF g.1155442 m.1155442 type:complete len:1673 (-) comp24489_c1_seq37:1618-6636(-)